MKLLSTLSKFPKSFPKMFNYFEILRVSGQRELTPEWLQSRYGSVFAHALLLGSRLWLAIGLVKIVSVFGLNTVEGIHIQGQSRQVINFNINECLSNDPLQHATHVASKDFLEGLDWSLVDKDVLQDEFKEQRLQHLLMVDEDFQKWVKQNSDDQSWTVYERLIDRHTQNYRWAPLSDEIGLSGSEVWLSIVEPKFLDGDPQNENEGLEPYIFYPVDPDSTVDIMTPHHLCELQGLLFESDETGEIWSHQIDVLASGYKRGAEYIAPATLTISLLRGSDQSDFSESWNFESVKLEIKENRSVSADHRYFEDGIWDPFSTNFDSYAMNINSVEDEIEKLNDFPRFFPVVSKMMYAATYVVTPLVCAFFMAFICAIIGQKADERPVREIFAICSHLLLAASGVFSIAYVLLNLIGVFFDAGTFSTQMLIGVVILALAPIIGLLRFFLHHFALQVTAACRYPVKWEAKSIIFGIRRSMSLPSILFRLVAGGIFLLFMYALWRASHLTLQLDFQLIEWGF